MQPVSFKRHRFPPDVIRLAVWLYFGFTISFRDVEEMLAQRGIEASYETTRLDDPGRNSVKSLDQLLRNEGKK